MNRNLLQAVALGAILAFAPIVVAIEIDPPLTAEEEKMLATMQRNWQSTGMPPMTDAQVAAWVQKMRQTRLDAMGVAAGMQSAVEAGAFQVGRDSRGNTGVPIRQAAPAGQMAMPMSSVAEISAEQLAEQIEIRQRQRRFTTFAASGDGFLYDGVPHIDPDGVITSYGSDSFTGAVSYLVDSGAGSGLVKHHNVHSGLKPITIGQFQANRGTVSFRSVDGETATGAGLIPTSTGVLVARDHSIIGYRAGAGLQPLAVPSGFAVAPLQAGDVASTDYILLERMESEEGRSAATAIRNLGSTLLAAAGRSDRTDYALFNVRTGKTVPLYVSSAGKLVGRGINCRALNSIVNECQDWESLESIWDTDGLANNSHYYWSIRWHPSRFGPLAVVKESGVRELNLIHLESGERVNVFTRALGISGFEVNPSADGSLDIVAEWAFKKHRANAPDLLAGLPFIQESAD